jgi:hypothetical protein
MGSGLIPVAAVGFAVWYGVQSSKGEGPQWVILKTLGLILSLVPIVGFIQYLMYRDRPSGYGDKCAAMALAGVVLFAIAWFG